MYAAAPHSAARGAYSSSSYVERSRTTERPGSAARICRVASSPLMPGRFTSIRTRSGASSDAIETESSPVSASPTTSKPSVASTTIRAAMRNGSWSSTMRTFTSMVLFLQLKRPTRGTMRQ